MKKGFSINDVTKIGRKIHNLGNEWECFLIDTEKYPLIKFGMGKKDENGEWVGVELHDSFQADDVTT